MNRDIEKVLFTKQQIEERLAELGAQLAEEYHGKKPLCICILKGAVPFLSALIQQIEIPLEIDFMSVTSYGSSAKSSGVVRIMKDLDISIEGRHVLIVEDIIDTGLTLRHLVDLLEQRNPASVKTVALLDKSICRTADIEANYVGFEVPNEFIVGFGLDYDEQYRNLPYIGVLKKEVYHIG
ncbi:hypoxanthine phosphoribosyltransferase [Seinonella peptonophila]|uniref:Hypoxanthine phosphoribosyltransferase n=1 Tax=Seinonella peptonophila TaxID=112248 RepID=A0A1M4YSV2_9BACL|nr:hypoxanthine phosphoribosyltransferase [Seinonella peptonophila]SHF08562.1 hypoxanthine phosphoribosyltransferase [Seinonella peptonophila]